MPDSTNPTNSSIGLMLKTMVRNSWLLLFIAFCTTTLIAVTYLGTFERIGEQRREARFKALRAIVPNVPEDPMLLDSYAITVQHPLLGYSEAKKVYRIVRDGRVRAVVFTAIAQDGYTGAIELLIGLRPNGRLYGVRTISHRETPGLGDKIDLRKSNWIKSFDNTHLGFPPINQWKVKRDGGYFDQFTGATITPRAVVNAVYNALEYATQNHNQLFQINDQ